MLTKYISIAMAQATYELLDDGSYYGEIPCCQGVWCNHSTLEGCQLELQEILEEWILLGLNLGHSLPILDNINLNFNKEVA